MKSVQEVMAYWRGFLTAYNETMNIDVALSEFKEWYEK